MLKKQTKLLLLILCWLDTACGSDLRLIRIDWQDLIRHARDIYARPVCIKCNVYVLEDHDSYLMVNSMLYLRAHNDLYLEKWRIIGVVKNKI